MPRTIVSVLQLDALARDYVRGLTRKARRSGELRPMVFSCEGCCVASESLDTHHVGYNGAYSYLNVEYLCRDCHVELHRALGPDAGSFCDAREFLRERRERWARRIGENNRWFCFELGQFDEHVLERRRAVGVGARRFRLGRVIVVDGRFVSVERFVDLRSEADGLG